MTPGFAHRQSHAALVAAAMLLVGATAASAQNNLFVGTWQGNTALNGTPISIVIMFGPDFRYSQQVRAGTLMTLETGLYAVTGATLAFQVLDWEPKTKPVYHPTGTVGGFYTQEPTARPPGGTFRFQFNSPTSLRLQDMALGGVLVMNRLR
jgi:hypothetical protein